MTCRLIPAVITTGSLFTQWPDDATFDAKPKQTWTLHFINGLYVVYVRVHQVHRKTVKKNKSHVKQTPHLST